MSFRLVATILFIALWSATGLAANITLARNERGLPLFALKVEGDIVPGDAEKLHTKLIDFSLIVGQGGYVAGVDTVYLMSKGGDVAEAMKMGAMIRRLRLKTAVALWDTGQTAISRVVAANQDDLICASACFLIYAGGVDRFGNYIALHRPYPRRETASTLSDIEFERLEKNEIATVAAYLQDMEVAQFWIDKMMTTNSQNSYLIPWSQADQKSLHLMGTVPSIEEIEIARCPEATAQHDLEAKALRGVGGAAQDYLADFDCMETVRSNISDAAFAREMEPLMPQCAAITADEADQIRVLNDKVNNGRRLSDVESALRHLIFGKYLKYRSCRADALPSLSSAARKREADDIAHFYEYFDVRNSSIKPVTRLPTNQRMSEQEAEKFLEPPPKQ